MKRTFLRALTLATMSWVVAGSLSVTATAFAQDGKSKIIHDAEYSILAVQNGEKWTTDDVAIDLRLAELRKANDRRPPNIVYILLDDVGYGEIGTPELTPSRGYSTPNIDAFARSGLTLGRMYSEPSCTPTRVAMMTGRLPVRTGLTEAKATIAGEGLSAEEVTLAEVLKAKGYTTSHVGKWHMGDIRHIAYKRKYADRPPTHGMPYEGIENLRPETMQLLRIFAMGLPGR